MTSVRKPLNQLAADLQLFGPQITNEINELKRNVEVRPITGATLYRHCLEDLNERLTSLSEDVEALESVSLDAISLEELVGHCASLYEHNAKAISALETRLQSYGYAEQYSPLPPKNPLDLLNSSTDNVTTTHPKSAAKPGTLGMLSPTYSDVSDILRDTYISPTPKRDQTAQIPPSTVQRRLGGHAGHLTAAQALAPMTAAKARTLRQDTPSSVSSVEDLTPSMRHLLGKYATTSSSEGIGGGRLSSFSFLSPTGYRPNSRRGTLLTLPSPSPVPLSPAFAAAAEQQRAQIEEAAATATATADEKNDDAVPLPTLTTTENINSQVCGGDVVQQPLGSPLPLSPLSLGPDSPSEIMQLEAADAFFASTAQKLASNPALLESYRDKYPHVVASTEKYLMSISPAPRTINGTANDTANGTSGYYVEETTMELKAQVIYNRALSGQHVPYTGFQSLAMPSATTVVPISGGFSGNINNNTSESAAAQAQAQAQAEAQASLDANALAQQKSRESLEEAIALALARPSMATTSTTTTTTSDSGAEKATTKAKTSSSSSYGNPTPHVTPATAAGPMSGAPSAGARTLPSARGSQLPSSLTPSLPTTVAPWTPIDDGEYSSLPGFVRGQMPLEVLNEAAAAIHASAVRRCAAGDGAEFTMDDIEEGGSVPVGKGKAFINALAKLGRVQLKVKYGQGTVYFFVE